jgi:hypothetical protein
VESCLPGGIDADQIEPAGLVGRESQADVVAQEPVGKPARAADVDRLQTLPRGLRRGFTGARRSLCPFQLGGCLLVVHEVPSTSSWARQHRPDCVITQFILSTVVALGERWGECQVWGSVCVRGVGASMGTTLTVSLPRPERPVAACFSPSRNPSIDPSNHRSSSAGATRCSAPSPRAPSCPTAARRPHARGKFNSRA